MLNMGQLINLDVKDRKILYTLEQDSRQSLQSIARKVGLSKEVIFHRIKRLEREEIINGYVTEIDIYKLGYKYFPVLIKFKNINNAIENEILDFLKKNKYVAWLTLCEGNWDINITLFAKDVFEISGLIETFLERYGKYIAEKEIFMTTELHYFKKGFWLNKPNTQVVSIFDNTIIQLKEEDMLLLKLISNNARISYVELSKHLNLTSKAIANKIKKLEDLSVLQGSHLFVNFSKLGYKYYKVWFSLNGVDKQKWKNMFAYFASLPNIVWATKLMGKYDLSIEMEVEDIGQLRLIISHIKEKFSDLINEHESILIFEEKVLNYFPK